MNETRNIQVFTVGHSNHSKETFLKLLESQEIRTVVDVRSTPYSQHVSRFNRESLAQLLKQAGMEYVFAGNLLGGRPGDDGYYTTLGRADYRKMAATDSFERGIGVVLERVETGNTALMCAEREPEDCHRTLMVGHELHATGLEVLHLVPDRPPLNHRSLLEKLMRRRNTQDADEAVDIQASKVAYQNRK